SGKFASGIGTPVHDVETFLEDRACAGGLDQIANAILRLRIQLQPCDRQRRLLLCLRPCQILLYCGQAGRSGNAAESREYMTELPRCRFAWSPATPQPGPEYGPQQSIPSTAVTPPLGSWESRYRPTQSALSSHADRCRRRYSREPSPPPRSN